MSLNPCFNGRYSQSQFTITSPVSKALGLNPCFNGRYSQSVQRIQRDSLQGEVLILVLMEDTLRA